MTRVYGPKQAQKEAVPSLYPRLWPKTDPVIVGFRRTVRSNYWSAIEEEVQEYADGLVLKTRPSIGLFCVGGKARG